MATTPVPQQTQNNISAAVQSEVSTLAHRHVTLSYLLVGVLVLTLALAAFGGWLSVKAYERALQRAEAAEAISQQREQAFNSQYKAFTDQLAQNEANRAKEQTQQAALLAGIVARDRQPIPVVIDSGLKPGAGVNLVAPALQQAYSDVPAFGQVSVSPDGNLAINASQGQFLVKNKVDLDRLSLDFKDLQSVSDLQKAQIGSLNTDLTSCQTGLTDAKAAVAADDKTIKDYKKAAEKTKFQKFLSGAEKVLIFAGGIYLGHKL